MKKYILTFILILSPFYSEAFPAIEKIPHDGEGNTIWVELEFSRFKFENSVFFGASVPGEECNIFIQDEKDMINSKCILFETDKKNDNLQLENKNSNFYQVSFSTCEVKNELYGNYYTFYFKQGFVIYFPDTKEGIIANLLRF